MLPNSSFISNLFPGSVSRRKWLQGGCRSGRKFPSKSCGLPIIPRQFSSFFFSPSSAFCFTSGMECHYQTMVHWSRITKNPDNDIGLLAPPFARSHAPLTNLLAPRCSLRAALLCFIHSAALICLLARSHSRTYGKAIH